MTSNFFQDRTVLVTGGTGFIGTALVLRLVSFGARVVVLTHSSVAAPNGVRICHCDITDRESVHAAMREIRPSIVYHCASLISPSADLASLVLTNVVGTQHILDACKEVPPEAVVMTGSWAEYGHPIRLGVQESDPASPTSLYGISKLAATLSANAWSAQTNIPVAVLRLGMVYGKGEPDCRLIPTLVASARSGVPAALGSAAVIRDFIHVQDVVDALICAGERMRMTGIILNIASGEGTSIEDLVAAFRRVSPSFPDPTWGRNPPRPWDIPSWVADIQKSYTMMQWKPQRSLLSHENIRALLEYDAQSSKNFRDYPRL